MKITTGFTERSMKLQNKARAIRLSGPYLARSSTDEIKIVRLRTVATKRPVYLTITGLQQADCFTKRGDSKTTCINVCIGLKDFTVWRCKAMQIWGLIVVQHSQLRSEAAVYGSPLEMIGKPSGSWNLLVPWPSPGEGSTWLLWLISR